MKNTLLSVFMTICFLSTGNAADTQERDFKNCIISHKGRNYVVKSQEASYPDMLKDLPHNFTAKNELNDLFDGFNEELEKNADLSLGILETTLKHHIAACERVFPFFVEFRRFARPKRTEGVIEEDVKVPQLTTTDKVRKATHADEAGAQQVISKTTFILTPENLSQLAQKKGKKDKGNSNQWQYLDELSKKLGSLSLTFNCHTTFQEGGKEDPVQTLSLVDANMSTQDSEAILNAYEKKMMIGPNAAAFTREDVRGVVGVFIYAPEGEEFPARWGTTSTRAASQFLDRSK